MNSSGKSPENVIDLIPPKLSALLDAFKASVCLDDFLRVLDVLATLNVDVPEVWKTWNRLNKKISCKGAVWAVWDWRKSLNFSTHICDGETGSSSTDVQSPHIEFDMEIANHVAELGRYELEIADYIQERIKDPSYPYGHFVAALPFEQILIEQPVIDEAARLIGQYTKVFFGDAEVRDAEEITCGLSESVESVRHPGMRRFIDEELIPWAFDAERRYWQSRADHESEYRLLQLAHLEEMRPWLFTYFELSDPASFPPGFSLANLARAIPYLPNSELSSILAGQEEFNDEFLEREGSAELVDVLLSLPLSKPFDSWKQYEKSVPENSLLREYARDVYFINELPTLSLGLIEKLIFELSLYGYSKITSLLQLPDEEEEATSERLRALMESIIKRLTALRRDDFGGKSPVTQDAAAMIGSGMDGICQELEFTPRHDITYLIGVQIGPFDTGQGFGLCSLFSYVLHTEARFARARSENLILVFNAAIDEGWDEFATASLAFYLFSQPILYDGELHADWHQLSQILRVAINLPGAERVRHAAALAVGIMREMGKGDSLDALNLTGWGKKDAKDLDITVDSFDSVLNFPQIVSELIEQIGKEAWLKLSLHGKRQLQNAENLWSSMHMQLGRGTGDFGVVATAYVKVFEGEIMDRMRPVTTTKPFEVYYRQTYKKDPEQHISLGSLLFLLKNFERLPVDLQNVIRSTNIRVHEDKELVDDLFKSMQFRNKGAHAGSFNAKQFIDLRKLVFEDQLLKRFIDRL